MIIDHTNVLRELYAEFNPHPTDGPVCELVTTLAGNLDTYSQEAASILDPVWEHEFAPGKANKQQAKVDTARP